MSGPLLVLKAVGVVLFLGAAAISVGQPAGVAIMLVAAGALAVHGLRDVLAPIRLSAGREGLAVVKGFAGHELLDWNDVQVIRVDERRRLGTISRLLEIDTGEGLYLFGESELSAPVESVASELMELKARYRSPS